MALIGRSMTWMGVWSEGGLNFKTHEMAVDYAGLVSIETGMTWSGWYEDEGFARVGIDYVRFRGGGTETFFLRPNLFRENVAAVGWRVEVARARVRGTITVDFWG